MLFGRDIHTHSICVSDSQKVIEDGIITQMRAEWILPEEKKMDVTLKILNAENHLSVRSLQNFYEFATNIQYKYFNT